MPDSKTCAVHSTIMLQWKSVVNKVNERVGLRITCILGVSGKAAALDEALLLFIFPSQLLTIWPLLMALSVPGNGS